MAITGKTTLEAHGTLACCVEDDFEQLKRYHNFNMFHEGQIRNLVRFFGGFYGFFWWLPGAVDNENDGSIYKMLKHEKLPDKPDDSFRLVDDSIDFQALL